MRIHFACGKRVLDGYYNIDAVRSAGAPRDPELIHALAFNADWTIRNPIPLADGQADELLGIHILEHFHRFEVDAVLGEWRRLLKCGGVLVLELPDLVKCARNLLELVKAGGKPLQQMAMFGIYGDETLKDPYQCHRYGWWPASLREVLQANGFTDIREEPTQWHSKGRVHRDMRIVARKA